jgi:MoaA/NifB/PqqE/SkfB family radical SAM enzyme
MSGVKQVQILKIKEGVKLVILERRVPSLDSIKKYLGFGRKPIMPLPDFAQIEVTTRCNFSCITCSRTSLDKNRINRDMTFKEFKYIIDQIPTLKTVKLQGLGEPFLNRDITQMARYAKGKGIKVITTSNGSIIPNIETLSFFDEITISFDSSNKQNFESIRIGSNFDRIINNIKDLVKLKKENKLKIVIGMNSVVSHMNYLEIPEIAKIASQIGVDQLGFVEVENWYIPGQAGFAASAEFVKKSRTKTAEIHNLINEARKNNDNIEIQFLPSIRRKLTCGWSFFLHLLQ